MWLIWLVWLCLLHTLEPSSNGARGRLQEGFVFWHPDIYVVSWKMRCAELPAAESQNWHLPGIHLSHWVTLSHTVIIWLSSDHHLPILPFMCLLVIFANWQGTSALVHRGHRCPHRRCPTVSPDHHWSQQSGDSQISQLLPVVVSEPGDLGKPWVYGGPGATDAFARSFFTMSRQ